MPSTLSVAFMFQGRAEEAMGFYTTVFEGSQVETVEHYLKGDQGEQGKVKMATFQLCGQRLSCIDAPGPQAFGFTPSLSMVVELGAHLIEDTFARLAAGGEVLVPLSHYGFSGHFGWITDRFGVSWQLQVPES
jgi:predicted 3-demethylubiquinone-9 3-methyltransferase (glyoxalase superfamily)